MPRRLRLVGLHGNADDLDPTVLLSRNHPDLLGHLRQILILGRCGLRVLSLGGTSMRITYDREVDALYFRFRDTTVTTKHLGEGIAADYDSDGRLAGIEILDAISRLGDPEVLRQVILEGVGPGRD